MEDKELDDLKSKLNKIEYTEIKELKEGFFFASSLSSI